MTRQQSIATVLLLLGGGGYYAANLERPEATASPETPVAAPAELMAAEPTPFEEELSRLIAMQQETNAALLTIVRDQQEIRELVAANETRIAAVETAAEPDEPEPDESEATPAAGHNCSHCGHATVWTWRNDGYLRCNECDCYATGYGRAAAAPRASGNCSSGSGGLGSRPLLGAPLRVGRAAGRAVGWYVRHPFFGLFRR